MAYDCAGCGHPDWAHNCCYCRHCAQDKAHHEFTVDKTDGVHWHGKEPASGLSPYQHELNGQGTACSEDCPACAWVKERAAQQRVDLKMPPKAVMITEADKKLLADLKVIW
jgi:hypothetical protein